MPDSPSVVQFDHFIPTSTAELLRRLQADAQHPLSEAQLRVMQLMRQVLSYEFNLQHNDIRRLYATLNPDNELILPAHSGSDSGTQSQDCIEALRKLLKAANYNELDQQQIQYALQKTSPYGLEIHIDFAEFEQVSLFYRGKRQRSLAVRDWKKLWLKKTRVAMLEYDRLFLLMQFKSGHYEAGLHLKLFKHIPRPDLEMLFPNSRVRMKAFDKLKIAVTGGGGTVGGLIATIGKLSTAISPWSIAIALGGFAALLWRQVSKVLIQKTRYMATLAQNLYFHNLDNNAGAISHLIDMARQEEIKEAILAYALLCQQGALKHAELDDACENWFRREFARPIDFDVQDAVSKLQRLGLIQIRDEQFSVIDADASVVELSRRWNDFLHK